MLAVTLPRFGGPEVLTLADIPQPEVGPKDVLIAVAGAGLNRADLMQREGHYPPPVGAPDWPGMELSGTVLDIGSAVSRWKAGDRVCALVSGGGYAERAVVDEGLLLSVPDNLDLVAAAGIPEAACTAYANVYLTAGLEPGKSLLVQGGSSGIGSMAIQLAVALGNPVFATAGSAAKVDFCESLGAVGINYRDADFAEIIAHKMDGRGVDVVLDMVGGDYLARNVEVLSTGGTVALISNLSGSEGRFDIGVLMRKRGRIVASTLRARPLEERVAIVAAVERHVMPLFARGVAHPVIDTVFALADAAEAHRRMESGDHIGKILLSV
ncbi:MAG TPA: NAD(P)H-quinone oxidoreductase [Galbitalea sp.]|jgi:putative PIG3 family NAD(P)H quinone oxidoreductase|nr:NAD(P)H-quinone oxidoreductase [Galbitalea sp.]